MNNIIVDKYLLHSALYTTLLSIEFWKAHNLKQPCEEKIRVAQRLNALLPESLKAKIPQDFASVIITSKWPNARRHEGTKVVI